MGGGKRSESREKAEREQKVAFREEVSDAGAYGRECICGRNMDPKQDLERVHTTSCLECFSPFPGIAGHH